MYWLNTVDSVIQLTSLQQYERQHADKNIEHVLLASQPHELPTYIHKPHSTSIDSMINNFITTDTITNNLYHTITASDIKSNLISSISNTYNTVTTYLGLVQSQLGTTYNIYESAISSASSTSTTDDTNDYYGYFRWIPKYITTVTTLQAQQFSAPCFTSTTVKLEHNTTLNTYNIVIELSMSQNWHCSDMYTFATLSGTKTESFYRAGVHIIPLTYDIKHNLTNSELYDIDIIGVRIFRYLDSSSVHNAQYLKDTLALFTPLTTQTPSESAEQSNINFMRLYANVNILPRATSNTQVSIDANTIQSGDMFGILRLDGLDPMLAWAMGSVTGHVTMALRIGAVLYVVESTTKDSYWPTNGIQKTEYHTWMKQAHDAGFNIVYAPLSDTARQSFNIDHAIEYFNTIEGYDYGYQNILYAWIDTLSDNYPCLPDQLDACLTWQHIEILISLIERQSHTTANRLFIDAFNQRLSTQYDNIADILYHTDKYMTLSNRALLPTIVESDTYIYNITRNNQPSTGPSMVCCVFVCNMWKHSGVFDLIDNDINCAELTNWDDYSLTIFNSSPQRPQQCIDHDPLNTLCQLDGRYRLQLNNYASKNMYKHMAEHCPSRNPDYWKPENC